jgi:hypothetical protein
MGAAPVRSFDRYSESEQGELLDHYARIVEILGFSREEADAIERLGSTERRRGGGRGARACPPVFASSPHVSEVSDVSSKSARTGDVSD